MKKRAPRSDDWDIIHDMLHRPDAVARLKAAITQTLDDNQRDETAKLYTVKQAIRARYSETWVIWKDDGPTKLQTAAAAFETRIAAYEEAQEHETEQTLQHVNLDAPRPDSDAD